MLITKSRLNPFQKSPSSGVPVSTRAINPGNGHVQIIQNKIMTSTRRTSRAPVKTKEEKCLDDFDSKRIEIEWSTDYDISQVHESIMDFLISKTERQETIIKTIELFKSHKTLNMNSGDISSLLNKIQNLEYQFKQLEKISILDYVIGTESLLSEYKELSTNNIKIFGQKSVVDIINKNKKTKIVEKFFDIAVNFCLIKVTRTIISGCLCNLCGGTIEDKDDHYACSRCHTIQNKVEIPSETIDLDDMYVSKNDDQKGIRDVVLCFEGKYPVVIPDKVIDSIKYAIKSYQNFDIKKMTKYDLYKIMKDVGCNMYNHINKIYFMITGKNPPDISRYENNIFKRGELFYGIYNEIKGDSRSNFIHGLYLLWLFLKNEGYNPDMQDFVMLKGRDVEVSNLDIIQKGFAMLSKTNPDMEWKVYQIP